MGWKEVIAIRYSRVDDPLMQRLSPRASVARRVIIAHAVGLSVTGMAGTIGTTAGFSVGGAGVGLFLGGLLSLPWIAALAAFIWYFGSCIERHAVLFAVAGPMIVCGTYALLAGAFLEKVAVSSVAASATYLLLALWSRVRSRAVEEA